MIYKNSIDENSWIRKRKQLIILNREKTCGCLAKLFTANSIPMENIVKHPTFSKAGSNRESDNIRLELLLLVLRHVINLGFST